MSKGVGASYVKRMKRYHRPNVRDPRKNIEVVCDRAFYHDGKFKYKLPRYYRDRFYRMKFPCDAKVWNKKTKQYENKIVYRYKSKNPLAIQMQIEVRNRILAEYNKRVSELAGQYPDKSRSEIDIILTRAETSARMDRQKNIYSKMSRFYNTKRFKNRKI